MKRRKFFANMVGVLVGARIVADRGLCADKHVALAPDDKRIAPSDAKVEVTYFGDTAKYKRYVG